MNIENLITINKKIDMCSERNQQNCRCKGSKEATPMHDTPLDSQSFLLVSRDPSNNANSKKVLVGRENNFFVKHILPLFYEDFDLTKAIDSEDYYLQFEKHFHEHVYWTHYAKCFPGLNKNGKKGHKRPNRYCGEIFLLQEIREIDPQYLILIGDDSISFITGNKTKELIDNIEARTIPLMGKEYNYLFSTHPSEANAYKSRYKFGKTKQLIQQTYSSVVKPPL